MFKQKKMINGSSLSNNELNFLCNSIVRLQKENGCFKDLKSEYGSLDKLKRKISKSTLDLSMVLVEPVWRIVFKHHFVFEEERLAQWVASIEVIKFIELIYGSEYKIFDRVSYELANQEFSYIQSMINEIIDECDLLKEKIPQEYIEKLKQHCKNIEHLQASNNKINFHKN